MARAKEEFLRHYERTAQLLKVLEDDEDSGSSEEDDEDEDSDESDESDDDDDDSSSSSEEGEDSDEDDDDDDDDEHEEEEEEEEDDNVKERQGYEERGREREDKARKENEGVKDELKGDVRFLFETALPGEYNIPFASPVDPTKSTPLRSFLSPSFLLQPTLDQTNFLPRSLFSPLK